MKIPINKTWEYTGAGASSPILCPGMPFLKFLGDYTGTNTGNISTAYSFRDV